MILATRTRPSTAEIQGRCPEPIGPGFAILQWPQGFLTPWKLTVTQTSSPSIGENLLTPNSERLIGNSAV